MTAAFRFFVARSVRNRLARQLKRLRSPRYAIAGLVGIGYFVLIFGGWGTGNQQGTAWIGIGRLAGPIVLALFASWWWLRGGHRSGITLSAAETHLLLPAPLTRGQLIRFKILQAQPALLFSAAIATLFTRGAGLPWPLRLISLWVMFATLHQHQITASLVHASAGEHGRTGLRRNLIPLIIFAVAFGVLAWSLAGAIADLRASPSATRIGERLALLLEEPGPRVVLAPFRLLLAPTVAPTAAEWALPFAGALLLLALHFIWVIRTDAAFEETAAAEGERREKLVAAVRAGGMARAGFAARKRAGRLGRPWLRLRPAGSNAHAILWKNVLYTQRSLGSLRAFLPLFVIVAVLIAIDAGGPGDGVLRLVTFLLLSGASAITLFGPFAVRNDLRMDLRHVETLRTYPVRSRELVAAEVAAAVLVLTLPQLLLTAAGLAALSWGGMLLTAHSFLMFGVALVVLPILNTLAVLIQNVLALLYPSWMRLGAGEAGGIETVGQNMIVMIGTLLLLAICTIPPLLAGAVVGAPLALVAGSAALAAGVAAGLAAAVGEAVLITLWLARLYDRTDPVVAGLLR